jgi:hypothetical protein
VLLVLVGVLGAIGQFFQVRAFAIGELTAVAPMDYARLIFAGILGFVVFAEIPDLPRSPTVTRWRVRRSLSHRRSTSRIAKRICRVSIARPSPPAAPLRTPTMPSAFATRRR